VKKFCKFTWLGNAGLRFKFQQSTLLVDPFLSRPHWRYLLGGRPRLDERHIQEHISHADYILVTHAHYDHLMDVPHIAQQTGATVFGSYNTHRLMEICGLPVTQLRLIYIGALIELPCMEVSVLPAAHAWLPFYTAGKLKSNLHPPLRLQDFRMDECFSYYLLLMDGLKILVWSSISSRGAVPADILFLRAVASERWYREMLTAVKPRVIIPTHWDDLFRPLGQPMRPFFGPPRLAFPPLQRIDLGEFNSKIHKVDANCRVMLPEVFREYDLNDLLG